MKTWVVVAAGMLVFAINVYRHRTGSTALGAAVTVSGGPVSQVTVSSGTITSAATTSATPLKGDRSRSSPRKSAALPTARTSTWPFSSSWSL